MGKVANDVELEQIVHEESVGEVCASLNRSTLVLRTQLSHVLTSARNFHTSDRVVCRALSHRSSK